MDVVHQGSANNSPLGVPPRLPRRTGSTNASNAHRGSSLPPSRAPQVRAARGDGIAMSPQQRGLQSHRAPRAPSSSRARASSHQGPTEPKSQQRQFEEKGGYRLLPPDPQNYKDLLRRQRIADQARPKPKAADLRFHEVADPSSASASAADREAVRERWITEMQAKADPKQIRLAIREQKERQDEKERQEERAKRLEFEKQWYEREAVHQAAQQERTTAVNACARQHWSEGTLPTSKPSRAEPIMPPEETDFSVVRRRMAAERASRGAALIAGSARGRVLGRSSSPAPSIVPVQSDAVRCDTAMSQPPPLTRSAETTPCVQATASGRALSPAPSSVPISGDAVRCDTVRSQPPPLTRSVEIAISAQAAVERQRRAEAVRRAANAEFRDIVASQDAEFEISLLHDGLKVLRKERADKLLILQQLQEQLETIEQRRFNAEQRLARYGENPKLRCAMLESQQEADELRPQVVHAEQHFKAIEAEVNAKEEMLAVASAP